MEEVLVSIILPVYNGDSFIELSIKSILNQTFTNFELIIINDGSTDNTLTILLKYASIDKRIKVISQENKGFGEALNIGINASQSKILARMDADDIMLPDRIEKQLKFLNKNPTIDVLSCLAYYINKNNDIIGKTYSDLNNVDSCKNYLLKNEPIGILHPGVMMRKEPILKIGGYRGVFWPCEDIDLWNRLVEEGCRIMVMPEILMKYRISNASEITTRFINSRIKYEWVRQTMWQRRKGLSEPTWEEFLINFRKKNLWEKLNWRRKTYAKFFYRTAGYKLAEKKHLYLFTNLLMASLLQPIYVLKKIIKQKK